MQSAENKISKWRGTDRCMDGNCAEVEKVPGGVRLTSTVANAGEISYTDAEWVVFTTAIKAGDLDSLA